MKQRQLLIQTLVLVIMCLLSIVSNAQRVKIYGLPYELERPVDISTFKNKFNEDTPRKKRSKENPWMVFCDREGVRVYGEDYRSDNRKVIARLQFGQGFYVVKEDKEWINIGTNAATIKTKGKSFFADQFEEVGWVKKDDLLLWNTAIHDPVTNIKRKAFLLNNLSNNVDTINSAPIYNAPFSKAEIIENKDFYDFFFVLKKENGMYLLSGLHRVSPQNSEEKIIGWVRKNKLTEWKTRVVLEPNFSQDAIDERQSSERCRVKIFETLRDSYRYSEGDNVDDIMPLWSNDPVVVNKNLITNDYRFYGSVMRFPLLENFNNRNSYKTGVLTKGNDLILSPIENKIVRKIEDMKSFNIFFLVEGTESLRQYSTTLQQSISKIENTLKENGLNDFRIGVGIYRDIREDKRHWIKIINLTNKTESIKAALGPDNFFNIKNTDESTCLYYGMNEALRKAGFSKNGTNILINVGNHGDFTAVKPRELKAKRNDEQREAIIEQSELLGTLWNNRMHIATIQTRHSNLFENEKYISQQRYFIWNIAKASYDIYREKFPHISPPELPDLEDRNEVSFTKGTSATYGRMIRPKVNENMSKESLEENILSSINSVIELTKSTIASLEKGIINGEGLSVNNNQLSDEPDIDAGVAEPRVAEIMTEILQDMKVPDNKITEILGIFAKRRFFFEGFLPKKYNDCDKVSYSQVLMINEQELRDYANMLKGVKDALIYSPRQRKEKLAEVFLTSYRGVTGNQELSIEDIYDTKIQDLTFFKGLTEEEGVQLPSYLETSIEKVIKDTDLVDKFLEDLHPSNLSISPFNILRKGPRGQYDYMYIIGRKSYDDEEVEASYRYYWIPIEALMSKKEN